MLWKQLQRRIGQLRGRSWSSWRTISGKCRTSVSMSLAVFLIYGDCKKKRQGGWRRSRRTTFGKWAFGICSNHSAIVSGGTASLLRVLVPYSAFCSIQESSSHNEERTTLFILIKGDGWHFTPVALDDGFYTEKQQQKEKNTCHRWHISAAQTL